MKGLSPTQRTLRALRGQGMTCGLVERWNAFAGPHGIRQDLFGILDIIALDHQRGVVGIQSTGQDFAGHYRKLTIEKAQESLDWLNTPGAILELWSWRKVKAKRGGKAMIWSPRVHIFNISDITTETEPPGKGTNPATPHSATKPAHSGGPAPSAGNLALPNQAPANEDLLSSEG